MCWKARCKLEREPCVQNHFPGLPAFRMPCSRFKLRDCKLCFILVLNLARQSFEMATKLPFGEIKSSLTSLKQGGLPSAGAG